MRRARAFLRYSLFKLLLKHLFGRKGSENLSFVLGNTEKRWVKKWDRKREATSFELWIALFADDCAVIFNSREELVLGTQHLFFHLRKFCLNIHVGRGGTASKTEAMFCPKQQKLYQSENAGRFDLDGDGFVVDFTDKLKCFG